MRLKFLVLILVTFVGRPVNAQLAGTPGAFTRLGFGARGTGMGNALTAVIDGDVTSFYNPAVTPFLTDRVAAVSYGLLSLDRSLNTLSYSQAIQPTAGFSVGIINSGVSNIDGRDADGFQTGALFTSENQFSFSFANRMSKVISLGIALKIYYYRLYENVSTTDLGIDAGGIARLSNNLTLGIVVQDIGSKYKWDTSDLYGDQGNSTVEPFPLLRKIGLSYAFNDNAGLISLDYENSNENTNIIRMGGELCLSEFFTVRAGLDHWDVQIPAQAAPTFGFTLRISSAKLMPVINYAYVIEPYGLFGMHILSLSTRF
jgi:hypothetical protein